MLSIQKIQAELNKHPAYDWDQLIFHSADFFRLEMMREDPSAPQEIVDFFKNAALFSEFFPALIQRLEQALQSGDGSGIELRDILVSLIPSMINDEDIDKLCDRLF